jgi:hypothetical protein
MKTKTRSKARRIVDLLLLTAVPLLFYSCVDELIFYPPACSYRPSTHMVMIPSADNQQIAAYYLPPPGDHAFTVLFSHGNAEDIGHLRDFVQYYHLQGFGILAYDYRGYGRSDGVPSEQATYADIEAAFKYLTEREQIDPSRIIAHGRSVGCGPTVWLASHHPLAGVILESPFVSAYRVMTRVPIIPFDKYPNLSRIKDIRCPVLVIHGRDDRVVPFWHGQTLYNAANDPKHHYWVDNAGHNDLLYHAGQTYWTTLQTFKDQLERTPQPERSPQ